MVWRSGAGAELRFAPLAPAPTADLTDTTCVLDALIADDVASSPLGHEATLELPSDGTVTGSTGRRQLTGRYVLSGVLSEFGQPTANAHPISPIKTTMS